MTYWLIYIISKLSENISKKVDNDKLQENVINPNKDTLYQKFGIKDNFQKNLDNKTVIILIIIS